MHTNVKLTNDVVDQKLVGRNIRRIDDYISSHVKIKWQCLKVDCKYIWEAKPNAILSGKTGCPQCANHVKLRNEIVDQRLVGRNINRLDSIVNDRTKIKWQCLICDHIWEATTNNLLRVTGCPKCANNVKLTNDIVDQRLLGTNIKRLGNYINNKSKIDFQCLIENCNYIWATMPSKILNSDHGCPKCNIPGVNEKLMHKLFEIANIKYCLQFCIKDINQNAKRYILDAYFPELKLAIEYNGKQHYEPTGFGSMNKYEAQQSFVNQQNRDQYIREFCKTHSISLIEIDGRKFYGVKLKNYLLNELIPFVKNIITRLDIQK